MEKYSIQKRATGTERNWGGSQVSQRKEQRRRDPTWLQLTDGAGSSGSGSEMCHDVLGPERCLLKQQASGAKAKTLEFKDRRARLNSVWLCVPDKFIICNIVKKGSKRPTWQGGSKRPTWQG